MRGKKYLQVLPLSLAITLSCGFASSNIYPVNQNNISIHSGRLNTRIILKTDTPPSLIRSNYSEEQPLTIILEMDGAKAVQESLLRPEKPSIIKKIKIEKGEEEKFRLLITLKEKAPYRVYSEKNNTIVELNRIHKETDLAIINTEGEEKLEESSHRIIYLEKIKVKENKAGIHIIADLSARTTYQAFALDNPLRLVVDFYNTLYFPLATEHPVNKLGVKKVRTEQIQTSSPHAITRLMCDFVEPKFYTLNYVENGLVISFPQGTPPSLLALSPNNTTKTPETPEPMPEKKSGLSENSHLPKTISEDEKKFSGEILSLKFKEADLRDVILYLGEFSGLNVVFDPEVRGIVTCNLVDIPWDQALDILLKNNKMGKAIEGNVLRVAPLHTLTKEEEEQTKLMENKELSGPKEVKTFALSYSKAKDIQSLLQTQISKRGEIIIDERTNTIMVSEVKNRMALIEKLISVFDTATPQVSIEARIVEATTTFIRNLGIQWGWRGIADPLYGNQTSWTFPNKILADGTLIPQGTMTKGIGGPLGGYAINLPAPSFSTVAGLSLSNVLDTFTLDVALSALENSGNGRIISRPIVTTQNNEPAEIIQGKQIPVQTVANFSVTTRYVNAALELKVTPQITAEGTIIMLIEIKNNTADFANLVNGIPPITTQSAKTSVMIPNGGTTVIGGIYRIEESLSRDRVPLLHKIPVLGNLFRSSSQTRQSRELLIFITPRIIKS